MASRIFLCLAAACCCCCIALLPPPVQARRPGLKLQAATSGLGGRRSRLHLLPAPEPRFLLVPTQASAAAEERRRGVPVTKKKQAAAAWSVTRPELRAVPGGPDPLHHHGGSPSSRRPEQGRTPSP